MIFAAVHIGASGIPPHEKEDTCKRYFWAETSPDKMNVEENKVTTKQSTKNKYFEGEENGTEKEFVCV